MNYIYHISSIATTFGPLSKVTILGQKCMAILGIRLKSFIFLAKLDSSSEGFSLYVSSSTSELASSYRKCRSFVSLSSLSVLVLRTDSFCQSFRVENFHVSFQGSVSIVTFLCTRNKTTKLAGKGFLCSPIFQQILLPSFVTFGWKLCRLPHSTSPLR